MALGNVLSAAQALFAALQNPTLQEVLSIPTYKSRLDELQDTVNTIKAVLRDADTKQELSHQDHNFIEKLKDAVFEADDLFDEFVTLAHLKQLRKADGTLSERAKGLFSLSKNPLSLAVRMSRGVKDIKNKLDAIGCDTQFSFKIDPEPTRNTRPDTCSYIKEDEIIGRQDDLDNIVSKLLDSHAQRHHVSFLSIVGIGGLGKTALAQLVYNDPRVKAAFPLRKWTCVSDEDQKVLDVKSILAKILGRNEDDCSMEQVQSQLRDQLEGKKYLLVLDDVWTEKRDQWCELVKYLIGGKTGSWILVTTRSQKTAAITGGLIHELSGLSKENSWHLFAKAAFGSGQLNPPDEMVVIGKKIVDGCSVVPLAIRVAGSLLYGQDKSKWVYIQENGLTNTRDDDNGIMPILKLSFNHLEYPLKNCFRYCALFPKDYIMEKEMLINLWMAQGYIVPLDKNQSTEDAAEEYFSILTRRCFFQDIQEDEFGEIESCKIHDLMHDIAQNVAGEEICALDSNGDNAEKHVCHLLISNQSEYEKHCSSLGKIHIRSLLFYSCKADFPLEVKRLVGKFRCLRVLDLSDKNIKCLPDSIGELLHLRYIDVSKNREMEALPNSITKLYNLQTLMLRYCFKLKELPKELSRLVNLKVLDIRECVELSCMPRGMGKLTCLHTLRGDYIVGDREGGSWEQFFDGLRDLKTLTNLKGQLVIDVWWPNNAHNDVIEDMMEGLYLSNMEHLNFIALGFQNREEGARGRSDDDEGVIIMKLMENLRPHSNLEALVVVGYDGVKMFSWVTLLPNISYLRLSHCKEFRCLSLSLENLRHLKYLYLYKLENLEYIEVEIVSFYPLLEELKLVNLPKFKGWRRGVRASVEESNNHLLPCFPQLKELTIDNCPELTCIIMVCPMLETLELRGCNSGRKQMVWGTKAEEILSEAAAIIMENNVENSSTGLGCKSIMAPNLRKMNMKNVNNEDEEMEAWLNYLKPMESIHSLQRLDIKRDDELVELPNWMQYLSSLQDLSIVDCKNLKAIPNWMPKLASLKDLDILRCSDNLKERCEKDPPGEDWPYIQHILNIRIRVLYSNRFQFGAPLSLPPPIPYLVSHFMQSADYLA